MPNLKITIEPVDLAKQKILEPRQSEFELAEDRFIYRLKFKASEPQEDEALPWIEVDNDFVFVYKRSAFAGMDKVWLQVGKRWKIVLYFDGVAADLNIYFKKQKDCEAVFEQLTEYFFGDKA